MTERGRDEVTERRNIKFIVMKIRSHRELDVYNFAFESAMKIFEITKSFPKEE